MRSVAGFAFPLSRSVAGFASSKQTWKANPESATMRSVAKLKLCVQFAFPQPGTLVNLFYN